MITTTAPTVCSFTLPQAELKDLFSRVAFAADSADSYRFCNSYVQLRIRPGQVEATATDGRHLATHRVEIDHACDLAEFGDRDQLCVLVPIKAAKELARMYGTKGTATINLGPALPGSDCCVTWTNGARKQKVTKFRSGEGRFPDWDAVVPDLDSYGACSLAGRVEALRNLLDPPRGVTLSTDGARITARADGCGADLIEGEVPKTSRNPVTAARQKAAVYISGSMPSFAIDPEMLDAWLATIGDEVIVQLQVKDSGSAILGTYGTPAALTRYVIMPLAFNR